MIQRIQSLWFLLAAAAALLTLKYSFYSGNKVVNGIKEFHHMTGASNFALTVLTVLVAVASLILIFLYKNRNMQKGLTLLVTLVSAGNIAFYFSLIKNYFEGNFDLTGILVFVIPVFLLLAYRGIWKDQKLVKSLDRLR